MKDLLNIVNTFGKEVCDLLDIDMPDITIDYEIEVPAQTMFTYEYSMGSSYLSDSYTINPSKEVKFNPSIIEEHFTAVKFSSSQYRRAYLKFLVAHELRHVWQTLNKPELITASMGFSLNMNGYGNKPEEKDANEFAVSLASNDYEVKAFALNKLFQELDGNFSPDGIDKEARILYLDLLKKEPIGKLAILFGIVSTATIVGALFYKLLNRKK